MGSPVTNKSYWETYEPTKEVVEVFDYSEEGWKEALSKETELIKEDVGNPLCLNAAYGGRINVWDPAVRTKMSEALLKRWEDPEYREKMSLLGKDKERIDKLHQIRINKIRTNEEFREKIIEHCRNIQPLAVQQSKTPEARAKRKDSFKEKGHQKGEKNSQFGTRFIHNPETLTNTRISKSEPIPEGWVEGARFSGLSPEDHKKLSKARTIARRKGISPVPTTPDQADEILEAHLLCLMEKEKERESLINDLKRLYHTYLTGGFKAVVESGYSKSQANLVRLFSKYLPEFTPQMGRKRGKV